MRELSNQIRCLLGEPTDGDDEPVMTTESYNLACFYQDKALLPLLPPSKINPYVSPEEFRRLFILPRILYLPKIDFSRLPDYQSPDCNARHWPDIASIFRKRTLTPTGKSSKTALWSWVPPIQVFSKSIDAIFELMCTTAAWTWIFVPNAFTDCILCKTILKPF